MVEKLGLACYQDVKSVRYFSLQAVAQIITAVPETLLNFRPAKVDVIEGVAYFSEANLPSVLATIPRNYIVDNSLSVKRLATWMLRDLAAIGYRLDIYVDSFAGFPVVSTIVTPLPQTPDVPQPFQVPIILQSAPISLSPGNPSNIQTWISVGANFTAADNTSYIIIPSALSIEAGFPLNPPIGFSFRIVSDSIFGFSVAQKEGQQIQFGDALTTIGTTGGIVSGGSGDTIQLAHTGLNKWLVVASIGDFNYN